MKRPEKSRRSKLIRAVASNVWRNRTLMEILETRSLMSGSIFVTLIDDANANGIKDPGENGLNGWTVFLDTNHNGTPDAGETSGVTNPDGEIPKWTGLANGTYAMTVVTQPGWAPSPGSSVVTNVVVLNNDKEPFVYFTPTVGGSVDGTVWNDLNADGVWDVTDPGLPNWTVYIDQNNNSILDAGEPSAITDANGYYLIDNVTPGSYKLRQVVQTGYEPTIGFDTNTDVTVTVGNTSTKDWGNRSLTHGIVQGTIWNDVNADGSRAPGDPGLDGWTVFIDANLNGVLDAGEQSTVTDPLGFYSFPVVMPGSHSVQEELQPGWNISPGHSIANTVNVVDNGISVSDFANWTPTVGSISGTVWADANSNGFMDAGEVGTAGVTIFIDANSDGILNAGEKSAVTGVGGAYTIGSVSVGTFLVREIVPVGSSPTAPGTGMQTVSVLNGTNVTGINFGNHQRTDGEISGVVFFDANKNGSRDAGERGLAGITIYFDLNNNGALDAGEPSTVSSADLYYTPSINEAGTYSFTKLPAGTYHVRQVLPADQSATPSSELEKLITLVGGEVRNNVNFANVYRANEIRGVKFNDLNHNGTRDAGEPGMGGTTIFIDLDRDNILDAGEPTTTTSADGSYAFTGLNPGAYVVREVVKSGHSTSYPATTGGILWPTGTSNPASGNVSPSSITTSLSTGQTYNANVSITLPGGGAITNMVDVFLLFDDTGSFTGNSPIVRAAFPQIISALQAGLPGINLGFGTGRFEEYANFAAEYGTGRPFILNQPIIDSTTPGFAAAIQSGLDRTAPGYGGDQPETDIEALFQMVTGKGFDGNNNGTTTDSGPAGAINTQINPGTSGDVPAFSTYTPGAGMLPAAGNIGGAGFRAGALPIILLATDTGFAYQPKGETSITGLNGLNIPVSAMTQLSRNTTPFNSGAGIQETITGLNALGALVIGLGTNAQNTLDPRQQLEAIARLTGATNQSLSPIANGTASPIMPGDPLYFQIASGFASSVANGVTSAIQNAATSVAVDIAIRSSDPTVIITSNPGVRNGVGAGQTANFSVTFTGDGRPHRFDLQFVRNGTNVVLGSIPVVIGTPIVGDGYEWEDCHDGEHKETEDFGSSSVDPVNGTVSGQIFDDRNGNGTLDAGETVLSSISVYFDDNNSGSLDATEESTTTSSTGAFTFTGLSAGTRKLRFVAPGGLASTNAIGNQQSITLTGTNNAVASFGTVPIVFNSAPTGTGFTVATNGTRTEISIDGTLSYSVPTIALPSLTFNGSPAGDVLELRGSGIGDVFASGATGSITHGSLSINYSATESLKLQSGTFSFGADVGALGIDLTGGASHAHFTHSQNLLSLSIGNGSDADIGESLAGDIVLAMNTLALGATGRLDVANNAIVVHDSASLAAILAAIDSGRGGFDSNGQSLWDGPGILSSAARTKNLGLLVDVYTLGAMRNGELDILNGPGSSYTTWKGKAVGPNDVLIRYTYAGDATLDGTVTIDDYNMIDGAFLGLFPASGWASGDFDHNGTINIDDYNAIDTGFLYQTGSLGA